MNWLPVTNIGRITSQNLLSCRSCDFVELSVGMLALEDVDTELCLEKKAKLTLSKLFSCHKEVP